MKTETKEALLQNKKEAQEYNERIYRDYMQDPDKVAYQRYQKILNFENMK